MRFDPPFAFRLPICSLNLPAATVRSISSIAFFCWFRSKILKVLQVGNTNGSRSIPAANLLDYHSLFQEGEVHFGHTLVQPEGSLDFPLGLNPWANELQDIAPIS